MNRMVGRVVVAGVGAGVVASDGRLPDPLAELGDAVEVRAVFRPSA